jgi:hypothetical protein
MGVSVESAPYAFRIDHLRRTKANTKFLSLEPLLGPLDDLDLDGIDWAIVGGESGPGARPIEKDWVRSIRDQCVEAGVPFHFKQWGGTNKKRAGRTLDGRTWNQWPIRRTAGLRPDQHPEAFTTATPQTETPATKRRMNMSETNTPADNTEDPIATELETIGDEYDVHREDDDEDNAAYAARILTQLDNMIDELRACQDYVRELVSDTE